MLTRGSILSLNYIRSGSPAILKAIIAVLGSWRSASWPSNVQLLTMQYVAPSHLPHTDVAHWHPSATPPRSFLISTLSSPRLPILGWLLHDHVWSEAAKSHNVFIIIYFSIVPFAAPNDWTVSPTAPPPPTCLSYNIPSTASTNSRLIVGCLNQSAAT